MIAANKSSSARRGFLVGGIATVGILTLPGCASLLDWSYTDAIRRLLERATGNAFAKLTSDDGFWNSAVARIPLPDVLGKRGTVIQGILASNVFRDRLQRSLNGFAEDGARRAAPIVADVVRTIGTENAVAIIKGGPNAATALLRGEIGTALITAMVPALGDAMRIAGDPLVAKALDAVTGVDVAGMADALAGDVDNAIWAQIAAEEAAIRADPQATGDEILIAALRVL